MPKGSLDDLAAFVAVARERSFTRAAAKMGVTQPTLSQAMRQLEERLGVRLLTRTTRHVSLTDAGERLYGTLGPRLDEIEAELSTLSDLRERPAGSFRITAIDSVVETVLWPKLSRFLPRYPDIRVELTVDYSMADIAAGGFDAGVRLGDVVAKDMIAVRVSPDVRFAVVGSPSYFAGRAVPVVPGDLTEHTCVNLRLPTHGGLYAWEFERDGKEQRVRVEGQVTFNGIFQVLGAAVAGFGLAYVPEEIVAPHLASGRLRRALEDWLPPWTGYHLYYPSRRRSSPAFGLLVDALRHREPT